MLMRHAKSSWKETGLPDHERPLNKRGRRDAPMMGERLAQRGVEVDLIISSSAVRAMATAEAIAEALDHAWDEIVVEDRLYEAYADEILEVIEEQDDWVDCLMVIGHNPGMTALANHLSSRDIQNVPTCGVVALTYEMERWAEVGNAEPVGVDLDYPKKRYVQKQGETMMPEEPRYIVLLGPPASGKGTQAARLREELGLTHVASGDLFRENLKNETALGLKAKAYMDRGELVPDDVTIAMVMDRLSRLDCASGALLDGFPRTIAQAKALDKALAEQGSRVSSVPYVAVPDEVLVDRVSGRRLCRTCGESYHVKFNPPQQPGVCDKDGGELYQRDDDKPETVRKRLKVYWEQTSPLIDHYRDLGVLVEVDGDQSIDAVTEDLRAALAE
jgi:adenylate kinase